MAVFPKQCTREPRLDIGGNRMRPKVKRVDMERIPLSERVESIANYT